MSILISYVIFIVYLMLCFYFNFELLIISILRNSVRWIVLFHEIIIESTPRLKSIIILPRRDISGKTVYMDKNHSTSVKSHLCWAEISPEMNSFLYKGLGSPSKEIFHSGGCVTSYKQPLQVTQVNVKYILNKKIN